MNKRLFAVATLLAASGLVALLVWRAPYYRAAQMVPHVSDAAVASSTALTGVATTSAIQSNSQGSCVPEGAQLVKNEKLPYADDALSFYYTLNNVVYYADCANNAAPLGADAASFELISPGIRKGPDVHPSGPPYAKDARTVFVGNEPIPNADAQTFTLLDPVGIAKDKSHWFVRAKVQPGPSPTSVQLQWPVWKAPNGKMYSAGRSGYEDMLVLAEIDGTTRTINLASGAQEPGPQVDPKTYEVIDGPYNYPLYAKDAHNVYCWKKGDQGSKLVVVPGADPHTLRYELPTAAHLSDLADRAQTYYQCDVVQ